MNITQKFWLALFYGFANHLPYSCSFLFGKLANQIRIYICRHLFKECEKISTINRKIYFGNGQNIVIGDHNGIGANCIIPNDIHIGKYIMMGPELYCITLDHEVSSTEISLCFKDM